MSRTQEKINQSKEHAYAGIDVSKDTLDLFVLPHGLVLTVKNDRRGIQSLIRKCQRHNVQLATLNATEK